MDLFKEIINNLNGILEMKDNYEQRKIKKTEEKDFILDTCFVTDRDWLYETAVSHINFNDAEWIVLGYADTKDDALAIHDEWYEKLKDGHIDKLKDVYSGRVYTQK